MFIASCVPVCQCKKSPVAQVTGLSWGDYIGSPDHPPPVVIWSSDRKQTAVKLAALSTGEVFGLDPFSTLLVRETGERGMLADCLSQTVVCHECVGLSGDSPVTTVTYILCYMCVHVVVL